MSHKTYQSGRDKGGPGKGGFLNTTVIHTYNGFPYTDKDPCMKIIDYSGNHLYQDHLCLAPNSYEELTRLAETRLVQNIFEQAMQGNLIYCSM